MSWGKGEQAQQQAVDAMARETFEIADRIKPILAGREPAVQAAVLAELMAFWLLGYRRVRSGSGDLNTFRRERLDHWTKHVWGMVIGLDQLRHPDEDEP